MYKWMLALVEVISIAGNENPERLLGMVLIWMPFLSVGSHSQYVCLHPSQDNNGSFREILVRLEARFRLTTDEFVHLLFFTFGGLVIANGHLNVYPGHYRRRNSTVTVPVCGLSNT
jgi:hypothetical protein